ncbi:hypothetical protein NX722_04340 [Endozoicomonas gorgoniicola]|uniref:Uncharacterized protein n=1 Tax=Endozoicomonas gorgoniicola TaxID=1234144 RepID=A0ABT3MR95_9GAMM|nr:hypothetical protein [Endozoicomonas gorgoniicola]MCW7551882.1 hypothetical protein [Endozoicomonas gorgoniicola]
MSGIKGFGKRGSYDLPGASPEKAKTTSEKQETPEKSSKTGKKNGRRIFSFLPFMRKKAKPVEKPDTFRPLDDRSIKPNTPSRNVHTAEDSPGMTPGIIEAIEGFGEVASLAGDAGDISALTESSKGVAASANSGRIVAGTHAFSDGVKSEFSEIQQSAVNQLTPEDLAAFQQEGVSADDIESVFTHAEEQFFDQLGTHDLDQFTSQDYEALQTDYSTVQESTLSESEITDGTVKHSVEHSGVTEYIEGLLDPVSVGIDVGVGIVSHSITLGLNLHKLSKLRQRKEAFEACGKLVENWKSVPSGETEQISVQDMKDYALIARLRGDESDSNPLLTILGEQNCHYGNDQQILALTDQVIKLTEKRKDSTSQDVNRRLIAWKSEFNKRTAHFEKRLKEGSADKESTPLKAAHQSKKMMALLNDIMKPVGVKVDYSTPLKKGKSALASKHKLVINENQLHRYLKKAEQLPYKSDVQNYITDYSGYTDTLEAFSSYEGRKIKHQKSQTRWTVGTMVTSAIPVLKADYMVRSAREFKERNYRRKNNDILDAKLSWLGGFVNRNFAIIEAKPSLKNALEVAVKVISAKKDRTLVKSEAAAANSAIDATGAVAGTAAATAAPGIGSLVADSLVGGARLGVTVKSAFKRRSVDKRHQQFGRIETGVYSELKKVHNNTPEGIEGDAEREAIKEVAVQLFDVSDEQVDLLFSQPDSRDLVSQKGIIRLRFNNL